jgi:acetoin utilization deacetylase AcuC-like enzyme
MQTAIVYSPDFVTHITPLRHPERPERVQAIARELQKSSNLLWLAPRKATADEILLCHSPEYLKIVQAEVAALAPNELRMLSTGDVTICPTSYEVARLAAGATLTAVDAVMNKSVQNAFCVVRPPGHHATYSRGMGFCLFNNVAIAARYVQKKYGLKRVAILDWDLHHGNGTQDIFYNDPSVFYFSTHQRGIYPGTGHANERGAGTIVNCEITAGPSSVQEIYHAFQETLAHALESFLPEFIILSAGFDAHKDDPLGGLDLTSDDYFALTECVKGYAKKWSQNRIVSVLEGGYNIAALSQSAARHVASLAGS